jgi:hypothetical protein
MSREADDVFQLAILQHRPDVTDSEDGRRSSAEPDRHAGLDIADGIHGGSLFQGSIWVAGCCGQGHYVTSKSRSLAG